MVQKLKKPPQKPKSSKDTKSRLRFLEAAEFCFSEHGYEGTKIRAIADLAEVNLGALHHYWGNKEALFKDVCIRRMGPMNKKRMELLDELEAKAQGKPLDVRDIFRASIEPTFFPGKMTQKERKTFRTFYGRVITEPSPVAGKIMREILSPVSRRILDLLRQSCSHLTDDEFYWRANCIFGAFIYAPSFIERIAAYAHKSFNTNETDMGITQIVEFLSAGIMAPSLENKK